MLSQMQAVTALSSKWLPSAAVQVCSKHNVCQCLWKQPSRQCSRQHVIARAQQENSNQENQLHDQPGDRVQPQALPKLWDGINWYCYTTLGLLFLTDFTPVGQWLVAGSGANAPLRLALLQWLAFVLPSLVWVRSRGWPLVDAFKLRPAAWHYYLLCMAAGPALWFMINLAIAIKTGNTHVLFLAAGTAAADVSSAGTSGGSAAGLLLLTGTNSTSLIGGLQQLVLLLLAAAASPAGK
eukprot:gene2325-2633_t